VSKNIKLSKIWNRYRSADGEKLPFPKKRRKGKEERKENPEETFFFGLLSGVCINHQ
jgi:hypothetical protein